MLARRWAGPALDALVVIVGRLLVAWLLVAWALASHDARAAGDIEQFYGTFVGSAEVTDLKTGESSQRDVDIVIQPYRKKGFMITWVSVTLVDGRRDVPGVARRVQTGLFERVGGRDMYIEVQADDPFEEREEIQPMRGDPVRWASIDGSKLQVYAFTVREDGTYELQISHRVLTEHGLDFEFQRIIDGEVVRRIAGTTARAR
jgi:hypothetical protein